MSKFFLYARTKQIEKIAFDTNLLLGEKTVRTAEGGAGFRTQNSLAKTGETEWALLRNAHSLSSSKSFSSFKVCLLNHIRTYFQNKVS
jgi:hypothetical protein